jgi:hypothetical protein
VKRLFLDANLLTGDLKDFGPFMNELGQTKGIVIQTVAEFLRDIGTK